MACTAASLVGVYLRASDTLTANLETRQRNWMALGFSKEQAANLVAFDELGLNLTGAEAARRETGPRNTVLFNDRLDRVDQCANMDTKKFDRTEDRLRAFGEAPRFNSVAEALRYADAKAQAAVLEAVWNLACAGSR